MTVGLNYSGTSIVIIAMQIASHAKQVNGIDRPPDRHDGQAGVSWDSTVRAPEAIPPYDEAAVAILVEIEEYLVPLAHPMDQRARRCGAIRRAIEVQVEYSEPLPIPEVLEQLFQALILQAQILGAEGVRYGLFSMTVQRCGEGVAW